MPGVEEFGIAAVEAQAAGRPVVAVADGGVLETVLDGETGVLLPHGGIDEFAEAIRDVDFDRFRGEDIARHAQEFSTARFQLRLRAEVKRALRKHGGGGTRPHAERHARRFRPPGDEVEQEVRLGDRRLGGSP